MPNHRHSLDIIVPCYNPPDKWSDRLIDSFSELQEALKDTQVSLILVNDGSTSGVTEEILNNVKQHIPPLTIITHDKNQGKGAALRTGVTKANAEYIVFTDVDFPYEVDGVLNVYQELCKGTDVALGHREKDYYSSTPTFRRILSQMLRWVLRSVLKLSITDTQCGLKGFNSKGRNIFLSTTINRFLFDLEFVMHVSKDPSVKTKAVLVSLRDNVVFSKVNMKVILVELVNFFVITLSSGKSKSSD